MSFISKNSDFRQILDLFYQTNYGEQYFDEQGAPKDLSHLLPYFEENFVEQNLSSLTDLLSKGVISTTMIRNLKDDITIEGESTKSFFYSYLQRAIRSVDEPIKTFKINLDEINLDGFKIESVPWEHDLLSPPCFLDSDNSMGRYREEMDDSELEYGEAIVEIRGIREVKPWFLRKCSLNEDLTGDFLRTTQPALEEQVLALFDFLNNFRHSKYDLEIFYLGIPYTLQHRTIN